MFETDEGVPLTIGGVVIDGEVRYGLEIPNGLSLLAEHDPDARILGLDQVPEELRPPVPIVRTAFQVMVAIGFFLLVLSAWFAWSWWRRRRIPPSRAFLWGAVAAGPLAAVALEAGWITTEVGRQPWIVYEVMKVEEAVTTADGIRYGYYALIVVYAVMTVATVWVLRMLAGPEEERPNVPPQEPGRGDVAGIATVD